MELHERITLLRQNPERVANAWAEYVKHEAGAREITRAFVSLLRDRQAYVSELERLAQPRAPIWVDFSFAPDEAATGWHAAAEKEDAEERGRVSGIVCALDAFAAAMCKALRAEGVTLTGGQISALKRAGVPESIGRHLYGLKHKPPAKIPERERLTEPEAAALYAELVRHGLIRGPLGAFLCRFGPTTGRGRMPPADVLEWAGNAAEFAYFALRYAEFTQRGGFGPPYVREKALCNAFGISDRRRKNTIRPYLSAKHVPLTACKINAAFHAASLVWRETNQQANELTNQQFNQRTNELDQRPENQHTNGENDGRTGGKAFAHGRTRLP